MHLNIHDLKVDFPAPEGGILPALGPISFDIEDRQFVCVLGPSGCGKKYLDSCDCWFTKRYRWICSGR